MKKNVSPEKKTEEILATLDAVRTEMLTAIRRVRYAAADLATAERGL